jgi:hypothetical protein
MISNPAYAASAGGLSGLKARIDDLNDQLIAIGGSLVVTGVIWAGLAITIGLGGAAKAVIAICAGLVISFAPQIVGMFIS